MDHCTPKRAQQSRLSAPMKRTSSVAHDSQKHQHHIRCNTNVAKNIVESQAQVGPHVCEKTYHLVLCTEAPCYRNSINNIQRICNDIQRNPVLDGSQS